MDDKGTGHRAIWLTPAGAGIALISFFLPWIRISCAGTKSYAGHDLGGTFWLVLGMAALIMIAFFVFRHLRQMTHLWKVVGGAVAVVVLVIINGCLTISGGKRILIFHVGPEDVNLRLQMGGYGTLLGFLLTCVGAWFAGRRARAHSRRPEDPAIQRGPDITEKQESL